MRDQRIYYTRETEITFREPKPVKQYGVLSFFGDALLTVVTQGLWLIWVFVREMRKR